MSKISESIVASTGVAYILFRYMMCDGRESEKIMDSNLDSGMRMGVFLLEVLVLVLVWIKSFLGCGTTRNFFKKEGVKMKKKNSDFGDFFLGRI